MRKKVIILGSTGSIGRSTLDVIKANTNKFQVVGLSGNKNIKELLRQVEEFKPKQVAISDASSFLRVKKSVSGRTKIVAGDEGVVEMVRSLDADIVVSAIVGSAGLLPTLASIEKGIRVCIANKEPLVMAGRIMTKSAKDHGSTIVPIDSEHSAIWQCLNGESAKSVSKIILTASGGPFYGKSAKQLEKVTLAQALKHPKWKMGSKITIDSSTMMNKGLEVIEAHWLFNMPAEKIEVLIHPQSIVHSLVEFKDSSVMAQLGLPDMKLPIAYALSYPDRWPAKFNRLNLAKEGKLEFLSPDKKNFRCLALAYKALKAGGTSPAVLNGANEAAVEAFLAGKIRYTDIPKLISMAISKIKTSSDKNLDSILKADASARDIVRSAI